MRKGYGDLIAQRRVMAQLTPEELATRLGKTKSIVYRLEREEQEPDVDVINGLVSALPLSAEELLRAMGVNLSLPVAACLPRTLLDVLVQLDSETLQGLAKMLEGALAVARK